ncbi:Protein of unknown function [Gryllus bimaculatus]|nr:Protein of unknown function [Gryllus bimaculatus]
MLGLLLCIERRGRLTGGAAEGLGGDAQHVAGGEGGEGDGEGGAVAHERLGVRRAAQLGQQRVHQQRRHQEERAAREQRAVVHVLLAGLPRQPAAPTNFTPARNKVYPPPDMCKARALEMSACQWPAQKALDSNAPARLAEEEVAPGRAAAALRHLRQAEVVRGEGAAVAVALDERGPVALQPPALRGPAVRPQQLSAPPARKRIAIQSSTR